MNFFTRQAETRRLSRNLVVLFALAVLAVVAVVDLVIFTVLASAHPDSEGLTLPSVQWLTEHSGIVTVTSLAVVAVIVLSSLYKTAALNGGGGVVAHSLGGVRVSADTQDPLQRRLLNIVEEMAIASGVPTPEVYLLEQEVGINAFAAGHSPANAAIAVTRGALTQLNRAELQGVIAHEFSHILNGDMRLNVRLIGLLFGLLVIALIARTLLRFGPRGGKKGNAAGAIFLAALAVFVVGYIGLFFGRLIQAAVSRSRESLADASAVQFTREPSGLRNALVKIGAGTSKLAAAQVEEVAHMLFAPGVRRLFATHPPLMERLKAIDPQFDPQEIDAMRARLDAEAAQPTAETRPEQAANRLESLLGGAAAITPANIAGLVGNPGTAHVQAARQIRESLPESVVVATRHPESARALLLALALDTSDEARERQRRFIEQQLGPHVLRAVAALEADADGLQREQRMPALLGAFAALRQLTREERQRLLVCLHGMLQREGRISLHSYVLRRLAQVQLRDDLEPRARGRVLPLRAVRNEVEALLCVLAQHGHSAQGAAREAYNLGMAQLFPRVQPVYTVSVDWPLQLDKALNRLDLLAPLDKGRLIEALVATISHDQQLTLGEAELLRAVCASLHCPLPPLIASPAQ
jgi:Zn-dependent protease with chaperone function